MKQILVLLLVLFSGKSFGDVNFIQFDKIPSFEKYAEQFNFLSRNVQYYSHWQSDWPFDASKETLVMKLEEIFDTFSNLDNKNVEIALLLGDISHYLYNLGEDKYFKIAEEYYKKAIELAPNDYRPYWFIANHYASTNMQDRSTEFFLKAQSLLPKDEPAAFWEEYAYATAIANMPSHCIYAMDRARNILGEPSNFEIQLGQTMYDRILPAKSDSSYNYVDIWTAFRGDLISFVCRPLGIKLMIDSMWQIDFCDYENYHAFVIIVPLAIIDKKGREIRYTIAVIMKVDKKGDSLTGFIDSFISKFPDKDKFHFSDKYSEMIAFELKDKSMYQEFGGGHWLVIGVKRDRPQYAGLLLENPMTLPKGESDKTTIYRPGKSMDRFDGVIYYAIMLDVCEDIYSDAYDLFKEVFEKQIMIE